MDRPEQLDEPDDGQQGGEGGVDDNLTFPPGALCQDISLSLFNVRLDMYMYSSWKSSTISLSFPPLNSQEAHSFPPPIKRQTP